MNSRGRSMGAFLAGGAVVGLLAGLAGADLPRGMELGASTADLLRRVGSADRAVVLEALVTIDRHHEEVVRILIDRVDPRNAARNHPDARCAAAHLLGQLRAADAAPALVAALADPALPEARGRAGRAGRGNGDLDVLHDRPVSLALLSIGMPAAPALVAEIGRTDDLELRRDLLELLSGTVGGKRRLIEMLTRAEARAADDATRGRLAAARRWVEEFSVPREEPLFW